MTDGQQEQLIGLLNNGVVDATAEIVRLQSEVEHNKAMREQAELDAKRHKEKYEGLRGLQNAEIKRLREALEILAESDRYTHYGYLNVAAKGSAIAKCREPHWFAQEVLENGSDPNREPIQ